MVFEVNYSDEAKQDLKDIYNHIANIFIEPVTAERQSDRIIEAGDSLDFMPFRFPLYDEEPWKSQGVRVRNIDKFMIFYKPDELQNTVEIIKVLHGSVDIKKHLPIKN
jgi:toxin ParE1/3/4